VDERLIRNSKGGGLEILDDNEGGRGRNCKGSLASDE
jgi:hypothetical protein